MKVFRNPYYQFPCDIPFLLEQTLQNEKDKQYILFSKDKSESIFISQEMAVHAKLKLTEKTLIK